MRFFLETSRTFWNLLELSGNLSSLQKFKKIIKNQITKNFGGISSSQSSHNIAEKASQHY
jgi:hypothetical protein